MPAISVIIPIHNAQDYLSECLASVQGQTLRDIEVVCIDDASDDASLRICRAFARNDDRFAIVHLDGAHGAAGARNIGIERATGDYLMFLDSDDWYPADDTLERLHDAALRSGADIVGGSFSEYDERTGDVRTRFEREGHFSCYTFEREGMVEYADWQGDLGFHRFMFRRALILEHGLRYPPYKRYEDPVFLVKAMLAAGRFYAIPDVVYRYRQYHKELVLSEEALKDAIDAHVELIVLAANNGLPLLQEWVVDSLTWHLATQSPEARDAHREAELVRQSASYRLGNLFVDPVNKLAARIRNR